MTMRYYLSNVIYFATFKIYMQNIVFEKIGLFFLMISAFDDFLKGKYFQKTFYK